MQYMVMMINIKPSGRTKKSNRGCKIVAAQNVAAAAQNVAAAADNANESDGEGSSSADEGYRTTSSSSGCSDSR